VIVTKATGEKYNESYGEDGIKITVLDRNIKAVTEKYEEILEKLHPEQPWEKCLDVRSKYKDFISKKEVELYPETKDLKISNNLDQ
jgi:phosphoglycerol transferase MdoB-like AlkP superfamily enzyme